MRSLEFTVPGLVDTTFLVTEKSDGTLSIVVAVDGTDGDIGDIRAVFFEFYDDSLLSGLTISGTDVTDTRIKSSSVSTVGQDANINGEVSNAYGKYDAGAEIGTMGMSKDDIQSTEIILDHDTYDLSIDQINWQDFAVRLTSVGKSGGPRNESLKAGITATAAPDALDDRISVLEGEADGDTDINLIDNDDDAWVDPDDVYEIETVNGSATNVGNWITVTSAGGVTARVKVNSDGTVDFDSNDNFEFLAVGESDTVEVDYGLFDNNGGRDTAKLIVTVNGVNDDPVANEDSGTTDEDTVLNVAAAGVLLNDTDVDASDVLTVSAFDAVSAQGAAVTVNADGSYSYDATGAAALQALAAGESVDDTFTYTVSDGNGGTDTATVTVKVNGVNDDPVANDDSGTTDEDTVLNVAAAGVLLNDTDVDASDVLTVSAFDAVSAQGAAVTVNADGSYSYDATGAAALQALAAGESVDDTFTYTVSDGNGGTDTATVTVKVNGVNDDPVANDDSGTTNEDTVLNVAAAGVLLNDTDVDASDVLTVSAFDAVSAQGAAVMVNADGSYSYDPTGAAALQALAVNESVDDTFSYTVSDGNGGTDTATVTVTVDGVDDGSLKILMSGNQFSNGVVVSGMDSRGYDATYISASQLQYQDLSQYDGIWLSWQQAFDNSSGFLDDKLLAFMQAGGNVLAEGLRSNIDEFVFVDLTFTDSGNYNNIDVIDGSFKTLADGLTDAEMSGWGSSAHGYISSLGTFTEVMQDAFSGRTVTAAKEFGDGNMVFTALDPSFHAQYGFGPLEDKYDFAENVFLL